MEKSDDPQPSQYDREVVIQQPPMTAPDSFGDNMPQGPVQCPPGLECLTQIDQLMVYQKVEALEVITGFETNNKYKIKNKLGQQMFYAVEDNDCCTLCCCGPMRPFDMKILDNSGREVIHLNRPLACQGCCCPCSQQSIEVTSPPGTVIGSVEQEWSIFKRLFVIKNANGETVLRIEGPFCLCFEPEFNILSLDGKQHVGQIMRQWPGFLQAVFTDADNFGITFPMDLDVKMKAVMLGACFLIDYMYFEKSN